MNKYTRKYRRIVDRLIKQDFPKLKKDKIFLFKFFYLYKNAVAMVLDIGIFKSIFINPKKISKFSTKEIKAILVHELCHIEKHKGKNFFQRIIFLIKYVLIKRVSMKEEDETNKLVIKKGYKKNLLSARIKSKKLKKLSFKK